MSLVARQSGAEIIKTVLRQPPHTYVCQFHEVDIPAEGQDLPSTTWQAILAVLKPTGQSLRSLGRQIR
jgi:hypothetical protein